MLIRLFFRQKNNFVLYVKCALKNNFLQSVVLLALWFYTLVLSLLRYFGYRSIPSNARHCILSRGQAGEGNLHQKKNYVRYETSVTSLYQLHFLKESADEKSNRLVGMAFDGCWINQLGIGSNGHGSFSNEDLYDDFSTTYCPNSIFGWTCRSCKCRDVFHGHVHSIM